VPCYVVGVAIGVNLAEGAEQHTKLRRGEAGWRMREDAVKGLGATLHQTLVAFLLLFMFAPALLGLGIDGNNAAGVVDGAVGVSANGADGACACTVDDDGLFRGFAGRDRLCFLVLDFGRFNLGVFPTRECTGLPLPRVAVVGPIWTNSGRADTSRSICAVSLAW
jgi:hypothetical protein